MTHRIRVALRLCLSTALAAYGLALVAGDALADVRVTGTYSPVDDPQTEADFDVDPESDMFGYMLGNEGIQEFLEFTFPGFGVPPENLPQETFEEGDEYKKTIEVGAKTEDPDGSPDRYGYGRLDLDGASILRYGHLVIGGIREDVNKDQGDDYVGSTLAEGHVTISGYGTVYNSSREIVPSVFEYILEQGNDETPREDGGANSDEGFDVYVGLTGLGTLQVLDGGRMEIGDSLQVGVANGSTGEVLISGFGSSVDQRGVIQSTGTSANEIGASLVGPSGSGKIRIENGGTFNARGGVGIGSIGVAVFGNGTDGGEIPNTGRADGDGDGSVEIDGASARLNAAIGVTVAPFFDDQADYDTSTGTGTLTIGNRALLNIYRPINDNGDEENDTAGLLVGKLGEVELVDDGRVVISDGLVNDGAIFGDGRIDLNTYTNRRDARFTVHEGEKMRITSSSDESLIDDIGEYFMANTGGLIEVTGGEIAFHRVFVEDVDRFMNRIDPAVDTTPEKRGRIHGQDATFRFKSGLMNQASLAFTAGDNILEGDVINDVTGSILLAGGANAVFEDDLENMGVIELAPDGTAVSLTVLGNFAGLPMSELSLALGGGPTASLVSNLSVAGDIALGGLLNVDLSASGISPLDPMPGDEFEIISGASTLTGAFNALSLPMLSDPTWSWGIDTSNADFTLVVLDVIPIGADFNGDGVVDAADLAIWRQNFGIEMGATGVLGDADLDGDVDGEDYLILLTQLGGAGMVVPGALMGPGAGVAAVPEPSTALLLLGGVLAGWGLRRR